MNDVPDFSANLAGIPMPRNIQKLPICPQRRVPVPWFVAMVGGQYEFRCMDGAKLLLAIKESRCWTCGQVLANAKVFVIGPMCTVNRISAEPPSHEDCARFAVRACPFLAKPHMHRRKNNLPEEACNPGGMMIERNPGVIALWMTRSYQLVKDPNGGVLFKIGDPERVSWWSAGRTATRAEVLASVESGLPLLCPPEAPQEHKDLLATMVEAAQRWLPSA